MASESGSNDLLRDARMARRSPSGSGRVLSRQELAEAVNAHVYATTGRVVCLDGNYIGKLERGQIRWPYEHYRAALRAVLGAARDADLGFHVARECLVEPPPCEPDRAETDNDAGNGPTLLRRLLVERHWQVYRTFRAQFLRVARELADSDSDPAVGRLDVSQRQFHRWIQGARPRPDACRVLEAMFGHSIARLLAPTDAETTAAAVDIIPAVSTPGPEEVAAVPPAAPGAAVQVSVGTGATVTVVRADGPGRVAVVAGGVRVLIEASDIDSAGLAPPVAQAPLVAGGARVYALAQRRAR